VANRLDLLRNGAVGFIDWLDVWLLLTLRQGCRAGAPANRGTHTAGVDSHVYSRSNTRMLLGLL
jgi:hypothetical protein